MIVMLREPLKINVVVYHFPIAFSGGEKVIWFSAIRESLNVIAVG